MLGKDLQEIRNRTLVSNPAWSAASPAACCSDCCVFFQWSANAIGFLSRKTEFWKEIWINELGFLLVRPAQ